MFINKVKVVAIVNGNLNLLEVYIIDKQVHHAVWLSNNLAIYGII